MFLTNISPPSSGLKQETRVKAGGKQSSASVLTLKMEAMRSSETSVDFKRITLRYIPEDTTLQKAISSLNSFNGLDSVMETQRIFFEVGSEFVYIVTCTPEE
jgi:hypothetical protein